MAARKFVPNPEIIYWDDNGMALCGTHLHPMDKISGRTRSGAKLIPATGRHLEEYKETAKMFGASFSLPRCERCGLQAKAS